MNLKYTKTFIIRCLKKARQIKEKSGSKHQSKTKTGNQHEQKMVIVPSSSQTYAIARTLKKAGVKLVEQTGFIISELIKGKKESADSSNSIVYKIPCKGCQKTYVGETYRGIKTRISEHKRDVKNHKITSSFVIHIEEDQHLPEWSRAEVL